MGRLGVGHEYTESRQRVRVWVGQGGEKGGKTVGSPKTQSPQIMENVRMIMKWASARAGRNGKT